MLDMLAQRYGVLPSDLLARGTTVDILVFNTSMKWAVEQQREQEARASGQPYVRKHKELTVEQMKDMLARVRGSGKGA